MQFGNWTISEDGITYSGDAAFSFEVPATELTALAEPSPGKPPMYAWVLNATDEEWLTHDDLFDFNYAFVFAAAKYSANFDYSIFDDTLAEQYDLFESEDEEE